MKKSIIASLLFVIILTGCGNKQTANITKVNNGSDAATADTASYAVSNVSSAEDSSSSSTSSSVSSSSKSKSKSSSSAASSKTVSDSKKSASSTIVGDENDPIKKVNPDEFQQYVVQEAPIVTDHEPDAVYENKYENIDPSQNVPDSWFDDCVFIGDSLTVGLSMYNDAYSAFGDGKFVCASCLSYSNSQWDLNRAGNVHPYYNGQKVLAEYAASLTGANKVIIGLGMNDIGMWGPEGTITYAEQLIGKIRAHSPGVQIYLETVTPMIYAAQRVHLNNDLIREFNGELEKLARNQGCGFLNSYDAFANRNGNLPFEFCSDPGALGIHLKTNACKVWAQFLKAEIGKTYHQEPRNNDSSVVKDTETETEIETETDTGTEIEIETETETEIDSEVYDVSSIEAEDTEDIEDTDDEDYTEYTDDNENEPEDNYE